MENCIEEWIPDYFFIPYELYTDRNLNRFDCFLWALVAIMPEENGCYLTNESLSRILGVSQPTISQSISILRNAKYFVCRFDGKKRTIFLGEKSLRLKENFYPNNTAKTQENSLSLKENFYADYKKTFRQTKRKLLHNIIHNIIPKDNKVSKDTKEHFPKAENASCGSFQVSDGNVALETNVLPIRQIASEIHYPSNKKEISYSKAFIDLISLWNGLGLHQHKNLQTKIIQNAYKHYIHVRHEVDLRQCIINLSKAALDPNYEPSNGFKDKLKSLTFLQFLKDPYTQKEWFRDFIDVPQLCVKKRYTISERHPMLVEKIKRFYADKCFGGKLEFTSKQEADFMVCVSKAAEYGKKYRNRFYEWVDTSPAKMVEYVLEALDKTVNDSLNGDWSRITSGWLASDTMFSDRLPKYLYSEALFVQKEQD